MHQASGAGNRKSPKRFSLLTFVLIGGTEEVESWFTRTSVMDCFVPRLGMTRSLSDAPRRGRRESFACRAVRRRGGHRAAGFRGGRGGG